LPCASLLDMRTFNFSLPVLLLFANCFARLINAELTIKLIRR
jgi:hypothetical protein